MSNPPTTPIKTGSSIRSMVFPSDPAASKDADGDGKPDDWNEGYGARRLNQLSTAGSLDDDDDGDGGLGYRGRLIRSTPIARSSMRTMMMLQTASITAQTKPTTVSLTRMMMVKGTPATPMMMATVC